MIKPPSITELTWAPAAAFAATIGVAVGILLGVIGGLLSWTWQVAVVGGVAVFIIAFLDMTGLFTRTAVRVMTMTIEALPMVEPRYSDPPLKIIVTTPDGQHQQFIDLPHPDKVPLLLQEIHDGRTYAVDAVTGAGKLMSKPEYNAIRDALILRGLAYWKNPEAHAQGWDLTAAGRRVKDRILNLSPAPRLQAPQ